MIFTKKEIGNISECILNVLDEEEISSSDELTNYNKKLFVVPKLRLDSITIEERPSSKNNTSMYLTYIVKGGVGVPLSIRINSSLGYSEVILKSVHRIKDYDVFAVDSFGNNCQSKRIEYSNLSGVRSELEYLASS